MCRHYGTEFYTSYKVQIHGLADQNDVYEGMIGLRGWHPIQALLFVLVYQGPGEPGVISRCPVRLEEN